MKKTNIKKATILLVIVILLATTVCVSGVYAWFTQSGKADAEISGEILYFDFKVNDSYDEKIILTDSGDNPNVEYEKVNTDGEVTYPEGMFPGQTMKFNLKLSNVSSDVDAICRIRIKELTDFCPDDLVITVKNNTDNEVFASYITGRSVVYPVPGSNSNIYTKIDPDTKEKEYFAILPAGQTREFSVELYWPYEFGEMETIGLSNSPYSDASEKNKGDIDYMRKSRNDDGSRNPFRLTLEVYAEQYMGY